MWTFMYVQERAESVPCAMLYPIDVSVDSQAYVKEVMYHIIETVPP